MKKSFILHIDSLAVVKELTIEQKADFLDAIVDYQNGEEVKLTGLMKAVFLPFKNQFDRDNEKYSNEVKVSSDKGKLGNLKRWHIDLYDKVIDNQLDIDKAMDIAKHRHPIVSDDTQSTPIPKSLDSDSKNDSDSKKDNVKDKKKPPTKDGKKISFEKSDIFDKNSFKLKFNKWGVERLRYYYNAAERYSEEGNKYINWGKAIQAWSDRDDLVGKLKFDVGTSAENKPTSVTTLPQKAEKY